MIFVTHSSQRANITGALRLCNRSAGFPPNVASFTERLFCLAGLPILMLGRTQTALAWGRRRIARWIRKAGIRRSWRCFGPVLTPDVIHSNGRCGIRSTANSLPMDRIHFGPADVINLPTSSRFIHVAMEGEVRAVSAA